MIYTWAADVSALEAENIRKRYFDQLGDDLELGVPRQEKALKLRTTKSICQSIGAGILLIRMRQQYSLGADLLYNLSHSGKYALCSVEDGRGTQVCTRLGCDIETVKSYRHAVVRRFFTETEYHFIDAIPTEQERTEMFYRYWVLKESFLKATRLGMRMALSAFEIQMQEEGPVLVFKPEDIAGEFCYKEYPAAGIDAKIAVCADGGIFSEEITKIQL